jgi:hypothetical protein
MNLGHLTSLPDCIARLKLIAWERVRDSLVRTERACKEKSPSSIRENGFSGKLK